MNIFILSIHKVKSLISLVKVIRLFQDLTFREQKVKVEENKLMIDKKKHYTPNFKLGNSVFKERKTGFRRLMFWKKPRNLCILLDGCPTAVNLEYTNNLPDSPKPALNFNFGSRKDTLNFIARLVAKSKAQLKPISNLQFLVMAGMLGAVIVFQFLILRGVKI